MNGATPGTSKETPAGSGAAGVAGFGSRTFAIAAATRRLPALAAEAAAPARTPAAAAAPMPISAPRRVGPAPSGRGRARRTRDARTTTPTTASTREGATSTGVLPARVTAAPAATTASRTTSTRPSGGRRRTSRTRTRNALSPNPKAAMTASLRKPGVRSMTREPTDSSGLAEGWSTAATSSPAPIAAAADATPAPAARALDVRSVTPDDRHAAGRDPRQRSARMPLRDLDQGFRGRDVAPLRSRRLLLQRPDDPRQRLARDPHERDADGEQGDGVRLEPDAEAVADVRADRERVAATAASPAGLAVRALAGARAEAVGDERDGHEGGPLDVLRLPVDGLHAEGLDGVGQLHGEVRHGQHASEGPPSGVGWILSISRTTPGVQPIRGLASPAAATVVRRSPPTRVRLKESPVQSWPGTPYPLGATFDGSGTNFALYSEAAETVELCLFEEDGTETRVELIDVDAYVWHCYLPQIQPGQRYGYRVHGPYDPENGLRCNPNKVLMDPYAKATVGEFEWNQSLFSYTFGDPDSRNDDDSAGSTMLSVVINPFFDWSGDRPPRTPYKETVIYEAHVKGLTELHPEIPEEDRGTYAGVAHPAVIEHLQKRGVTAIELMPVHQFVQDATLLDKGLRNYWGYNTIGFFAPHNEYAATGQLGQQVQEFKSMVRSLHAAGIEVILDVVYNHTAEGNHMGPTLSFRGIDNAAYYRLVDDDKRYYMDYTGTGNSFNVRHPHALQLIMDSLRYWVTEMHVDGFRFDLAATLAREFYEVDRLSTFFELVQQDPVVSQVKLIAEPWDIGPGGYQVGNFPPQWTEWNGKYRDTVRDFWRGEPSTLGEFAARITGSADLYERTARRPVASINFVTAHDGFTLRDLVSYNEKHNEANGENNNDGESHNQSWNCGVEGPTDDPEVLALRARQVRNLLATLLLSQGVPMLLGGDELGRTQR